jgi:hypothetical protein
MCQDFLLQGRGQSSAAPASMPANDAPPGEGSATPASTEPTPSNLRNPMLPLHPATSVGQDDLHPAGLWGGVRVGPGMHMPDSGGGSQVGPGHPMFAGGLHGPPGLGAGPGRPGVRFDPIGVIIFSYCTYRQLVVDRYCPHHTTPAAKHIHTALI